MNLTAAIIERVFQYFNVSLNETKNLEAMKLDKTISIELDDGQKIERPLYGFIADVSDIKVKALIADLTIETDKEFVLLLQLNDLSIYSLKLSVENNKIYCSYEDKWISLSPLLQAKFLYGFEQLSELFISWNKNENYHELYKQLISFLNYAENN